MRIVHIALVAAICSTASGIHAASFKIDPTHTFVQFEISHLGVSTLVGRFNDVKGTLMFDADKPQTSKVDVTISTKSIDTNHAERDKHLRSKDFFNVDKFSDATFAGTEFTPSENGSGVLKGNLTLLGVTKPVIINVKKVGEGKDPWGGYRAGFEGETTINRSDYGMKYNLGPASETVTIKLFLEGIRQ